MHALQNYIVEPLSGTNLPPYLLLLFDQRQICDVRANLQTANVIGRLTTNLGKTLIESILKSTILKSF